jgi:hypothetical protein
LPKSEQKEVTIAKEKQIIKRFPKQTGKGVGGREWAFNEQSHEILR